MTRVELIRRARDYATWRYGERAANARLHARDEHISVAALGALPSWTSMLASDGDGMSRTVGAAVEAWRAASSFDSDTLRRLAHEHGEARLDALLALPGLAEVSDDDVSQPDARDTIMAAVLAKDSSVPARQLIDAILDRRLLDAEAESVAA